MSLQSRAPFEMAVSRWSNKGALEEEVHRSSLIEIAGSADAALCDVWSHYITRRLEVLLMQTVRPRFGSLALEDRLDIFSTSQYTSYRTTLIGTAQSLRVKTPNSAKVYFVLPPSE